MTLEGMRTFIQLSNFPLKTYLNVYLWLMVFFKVCRIAARKEPFVKTWAKFRSCKCLKGKYILKSSCIQTSWGQHCVWNDAQRDCNRCSWKWEPTQWQQNDVHIQTRGLTKSVLFVCQSVRWPEQQHGGCRHNGRVPENVGAGQGE